MKKVSSFIGWLAAQLFIVTEQIFFESRRYTRCSFCKNWFRYSGGDIVTSCDFEEVDAINMVAFRDEWHLCADCYSYISKFYAIRQKKGIDKEEGMRKTTFVIRTPADHL